MFRVKVNFTTKSGDEKSKSLIVKTKPFIASPKMEMLEKSTIFDIEIKMYTKTIPEMHRLLRAVEDKTQFGPILLYSTKEPSDTLVFNDLCDENYEVASGPLDYDGSKLVYEQIAKWHACTFNMANDRSYNDEFDYYDQNLYNGLLGDDIMKIFVANFTQMFDIIKEWPEMEKYESNFSELMKNYQATGIATYKPSKGYNVLCHSDLHSKNLMIKKQEGKIVDVRLVSIRIYFPK